MPATLQLDIKIRTSIHSLYLRWFMPTWTRDQSSRLVKLDSIMCEKIDTPIPISYDRYYSMLTSLPSYNKLLVAMGNNYKFKL